MKTQEMVQKLIDYEREDFQKQADEISNFDLNIKLENGINLMKGHG